MSYPNNPPVPASITVDTTASINSGLVGFWPLTDGTGTTATDLSTGGNDGTQSGGVSWASTEKGTAASFDGGDDYFSLASNSAVDLTSNFTVVAWVKCDASSDTGYIAAKAGSGSTGFQYGIYQSNTVFRALMGNATSGVQTVNGGLVSAGSWQMVVGSYDGTNLKCEVWTDGSSVSGTTTAAGSGLQQIPIPFSIGARNNGSNEFDGNIQNVRVYNRALTATEVAELYSVPWTGTDYVAQNLTPDTPIAMGVDPNHSLSSGLVGYWPLSEGSGTTAKDISGNSNDLTNTFGTVGWTNSTLGTAADFTGTGLLSTSTVPTLTDKLTISQWLYYAGSIERESSFVGNTSSANYAWGFRTENAGDYMRFFVNGSFTDSSQLPRDQWVHVVGVYDGTDIRLYVDGVQDGTPTSVTGNVNSFNNIFIGNQSASSSVFPFTGFAQNTRIYNRALSATEVEALYNEPWAGVVTAKSAPPQYLTVDTADSINTGLQGFWPLSDGSGTTAVDLSANGNDGTQSGGVSWTADDKGVSASFDGTDDRFDLTNLGMDFSSDDFTVSMWIYVDSISSPEYLWVKQTSGNSFSCIFWVVTATRLQLIHQGSTANCTTDYVIASSLVGGWNHLVASVSSPSSLLASNHAIYLNGELLTPNASVNGAGTITESSGTLSLAGRISDNLRQLSGDYQNVRLYDRALSAAEVSRLYQDPWAGTDRAIEPSPTAKDLDTSSSLTTNLVGWWPLTEFGPQDTLAYDISGSGNHGVANGGVQRQFTDTVRAATFDGVDDRFEIDDAGAFDFSTGDFSVSAWVYFDAVPASIFHFASRGDTVLGSACWFGLNKTTSNKFDFVVDDNVTKREAIGSTTVASGRWYHVVGVRNSAGTNTLYVDGVSDGTVADNGNSVSQSAAAYRKFRVSSITNSGTYNEHHDGNIQNVRVYSRALSAAEVQTLYDDPWVGLATDSLVYAYYSAAFLQRLG